MSTLLLLALLALVVRTFSYFDAVLVPIVDALNLVLHNESDAWLSLQARRAPQGPGRSLV